MDTVDNISNPINIAVHHRCYFNSRCKIKRLRQWTWNLLGKKFNWQLQIIFKPIKKNNNKNPVNITTGTGNMERLWGHFTRWDEVFCELVYVMVRMTLSLFLLFLFFSSKRSVASLKNITSSLLSISRCRNWRPALLKPSTSWGGGTE